MRPARVLFLFLTCLPAVASSVGAEPRCDGAKLRAMGAESKARLLCEARTIAVGADAACLEAAAARRERSFRRAEARGDCTRPGDSEAAGRAVESFVLNVLLEQRPRTAESRCTQRRLLVAGRAAEQISALYAHAGARPDEERLLRQLAATRGKLEAAYDRAGRFEDCLYPYPTRQALNNFIGGTDRLRDQSCPRCGLLCPCWTTAELNHLFPPGAFDAMGGAVCRLEQLGYLAGVTVTAVDRCRYRPTSWPQFLETTRAGFGIRGEWCLLPRADLDPDNDGWCNGEPRMSLITPALAERCLASALATDIYRSECRVPN
jgi:hypothetical protein